MQRIPTGDNANFESALMDTTRGLMPLGPRTTFLRIIPSQANDLEAQWEDGVNPLAILFAQAQSQRQLRSDLRTRWLVASYIGLLFAAWDEITQGELGPSQAARLVVDTWLTGVINTAATE
jgi:hypothetical protein